MDILLISSAALAIFMSILFLIALQTKNNGVADIGYGCAFLVVIGATLLQVSQHDSTALILSVFPFIWGIRLAVRIYLKNKGKPEDFRYKSWRDSWGDNFLVRSFFQIYMLQGFIALMIASPVLAVILFPSGTPIWTLFYGGLIVWLIGFFFEARGDYELDTFIHNPANKGRIMMSGLWAYTRHPNYFGESLMWWGIAIAALGASYACPIYFVSPLLITFLLLKVSGVPLLEKRWEGNPEWESYKAKTPVFVPRFPGL